MEQRHTLKNGTSSCHASIVHQHIKLPLHLKEEEKHSLQVESVLCRRKWVLQANHA